MTDGASALIPPNDIKLIVEKTASYVARVGETFERKVAAKERDNPKFAFLRPTDAYHTYYRARVSYYQHNSASPSAAAPPAPVAAAPSVAPAAPSVSSTAPAPGPAAPKDAGVTETKIASREAETNASGKPRVLQPPPKDRFSFMPPHIPLQDLDTMKLTAQFVARNGQSFQMSLMAREQRNPTFDFMKPTNQYYPYFQALVEQYRAVLLPPRGIVETLRRGYATRYDVLARLVDRVEWELQQDREKKQAELEREAEKVAYASIDWQHFVVVQTIDLDDDDDDDDEQEQEQEQEEEVQGSVSTSSNSSTEQRGRRTGAAEEMQRRTIAAALQTGPDAGGLKRDHGDADGDQEAPAAGPAPKKTKRSRARGGAGVLTQICPNCGQAIPIEEMTEHLRIETLDPRAREQKAVHVERLRGANATLAGDLDIAANLDAFAVRRTDIFGSKDAEISAIEAARERDRAERERARAQEAEAWDGFSTTVPCVSPAAPAPPTSAPVLPNAPQPPLLPPQQQLQQQQQQQQPPVPLPPGLPPLPLQQQQQQPLPPPPMPVQPAPGLGVPQPVPPPPPLPPQPQQTPPGPPPGGLVDEAEFMRAHGGPDAVVHVRVQLPQASTFTASAATAAWSHLGEVLTCTLRLGESVAALKAAVHVVCAIPPNKQKLTAGRTGEEAPGTTVLRDKDSLAACNIADHDMVFLRIKERGGKKK